MAIHIKIKTRKQKGSSLIDFAAAMTWGIPMLTTILLAGVQLGTYTLATEAIASGAREAARGLAIAYGQDPTIATNRGLQEQVVFDNIRKPGFINASTQFANPVFSTQTNGLVTITSVTATVTLSSGQTNCVSFSGLLPIPTQVQQSATYRCE